MFDLGWSELLVIAVVAIIVVGPRDLPGLLRNVGRLAGQARRMANDFTRQFNDALRESELDDMKKSVGSIATANPLKDIGRDITNAIKPADVSSGSATATSSTTASVADKAKAAVQPGTGTAAATAGKPAAEAATATSPSINGHGSPDNVASLPSSAAATDDGAGDPNAARGRVADRAEQAWKAAANDDTANKQGGSAGE